MNQLTRFLEKSKEDGYSLNGEAIIELLRMAKNEVRATDQKAAYSWEEVAEIFALRGKNGGKPTSRTVKAYADRQDSYLEAVKKYRGTYQAISVKAQWLYVNEIIDSGLNFSAKHINELFEKHN